MLARRIFLKTILTDSEPLKKRWPVDASEMQAMYLIAESLVLGWNVIKDEFKTTKTLKDKPPEKLLEDGFSTPMPLFCLICTIISSKTCILD